MGMATSKVRLNICGSSYVVNTSESEDYMQNLADRLNLDMNELMASSNSVSITTAAVMAALTTCAVKSRITSRMPPAPRWQPRRPAARMPR